MDYSKSSPIAVLIDGENIAASDIGVIFEYIRPYGSITLVRVYGDFSLPHMSGWKSAVEQHAIAPVHQYGWVKGKSASDMAMVIDAMDLLYSPPNGVVLGGFCLVSSDSDFTHWHCGCAKRDDLCWAVDEQQLPPLCATLAIISRC